MGLSVLELPVAMNLLLRRSVGSSVMGRVSMENRGEENLLAG